MICRYRPENHGRFGVSFRIEGCVTHTEAMVKPVRPDPSLPGEDGVRIARLQSTNRKFGEKDAIL